MSLSALPKGKKSIQICCVESKQKFLLECQDQRDRDLFLTYLQTELESVQNFSDSLANPKALTRKQTLRRRMSLLIQ